MLSGRNILTNCVQHMLRKMPRIAAAMSGYCAIRPSRPLICSTGTLARIADALVDGIHGRLRFVAERHVVNLQLGGVLHLPALLVVGRNRRDMGVGFDGERGPGLQSAFNTEF